MYHIKRIILVLNLAGISFAVYADMTAGLAVAAGQNPYKDYDTMVMPIPVIQYQKDRFYFDSFKVGVNVVNQESTKVDIHTSYLPLEFKGSKTDDKQLKKLDRRKSTLLSGAGISHQFSQQKTTVKASLSADILDNSNTVLGEVALNHHFQITEKAVVIPTIGVLWANKKHNTYYYGVSSKESTKTGISQYKADSSAHPYLGIHLHYGLKENIALFASGRVDFLSDQVKDSPMVDRSTITAIAVGATYSFK